MGAHGVLLSSTGGLAGFSFFSAKAPEYSRGRSKNGSVYFIFRQLKNELKISFRFRIFEGYYRYYQCPGLSDFFLKEASSQLANRKRIVAREIWSGKDKSLLPNGVRDGWQNYYGLGGSETE